MQRHLQDDSGFLVQRPGVGINRVVAFRISTEVQWPMRLHRLPEALALQSKRLDALESRSL